MDTSEVMANILSRNVTLVVTYNKYNGYWELKLYQKSWSIDELSSPLIAKSIGKTLDIALGKLQDQMDDNQYGIE